MTSFATYDQVKNFVFSSDCDYNKNLSSETLQFSSDAVTVGVGSYALRQYTIPLSEETRHYQLYVNLSLDSGEYYAMPNPDRRYGTGNVRTISVNVSQNGTDLTLNVYLINSSPGSQNFPTFTINATRRDFVDEIT